MAKARGLAPKDAALEEQEAAIHRAVAACDCADCRAITGATAPLREARQTQTEDPAKPKSIVPWIGFLVKKPKSHRVYVEDVVEGGPAAAAGLQDGDVLTRLGDTEIHDMKDFWKAMKMHKVRLSDPRRTLLRRAARPPPPPKTRAAQGPRSIASPGEGGPSRRCELGEGGVWKTGPKGRTLFVPRAKKKKQVVNRICQIYV